MECGGSKFLHSLLLGSLIMFLQVLLVTNAKSENEETWTFNIPGVSFISFSPSYTNTQNQRIALSFRTRNPNGLIFCHFLKDLDEEELRKINYKLCGELRYGLFMLNYRLRHFREDGMTLGKALHNDQWHNLDILINVTSGELTVNLDKETKVTTLKAYTRQNFTGMLDWTSHGSAIYFGGTDPDTLFANIVPEFPHFIGCMCNIRYIKPSVGLTPIPVEMMEGVEPGCRDHCTDSPCHHGGQCINAYTGPICDCFGTDYQGPFCSDLGPTTITLRGYEWLTYSMYPDNVNILIDRFRFSLEFKTSRGSGVLLYAVGGAPYHSHVTASVHNGTVKVSWAFGDEDIDITVGVGVDNYRWHNLTVLHENRSVAVYLDGQENKREITGPTYHLGLDPKVFIGGGDNFIETRGLQVTQNFVGCVKNVYINEVSVLHEMLQGNEAALYHGGGSMQPHYVCQEVVNIPISFPTSSSMLILDYTDGMTASLDIEFDFKTVRSEAILLFTTIKDTDTSMGFSSGYIEVWIHQGRPLLKFVPSSLHPDQQQNFTIPMTVNNNQWNTMQLAFRNGQAKLKVNGISISTKDNGRPLEVMNSVIVGYGFNTYKESEGYVGCIRNAKFQGGSLDALDLLETRAAQGLIIDGCNITDYCQDNTMCQHGGKCLSEWTGVACDCTETFYTGRACHFSKYKHSCDEYFQAGSLETGVRLVDLDGPGPLDPVHVRCEMAYEYNLELFGKTVITHNMEENTTVRAPLMRNLKKLIKYRELNREQLILLTQESAWCKQYIRYDCRSAPIRLGVLTYFKAANGEIVEYVGTSNTMPGSCTCSLAQNCAGDEMCNCDNETMTVQHDEGYNSVGNQLPLTEISVKQEDDPLAPSSANLTLGPLLCWGNKLHMPSQAVTYSSSKGFLVSGPWKSGTLKVSFRTHHNNAIILYQTGSEANINYFFIALTNDQAPHYVPDLRSKLFVDHNYVDHHPVPDWIRANINYFFIALTNEYTVKFYFRWGMRRLQTDIVSKVPINNGQWHQIIIETDRFNVRCTMDMLEKILEIPDGVPKVTEFSGILYVGGVANSVQKDHAVESVVGIVGCMRGLYYNNRAYDLSRLIDSSTIDVQKECMASCWPNPCKNDGICKEKWGAHECECKNPWAHSGHNCEIDINQDMVTFSGRAESHLHIEKPADPELLDSTIIFSFRTFAKTALLLYVHDNLNNFIQVQLIDGIKVVATFNRYNSILNQTKVIKDGHLDNGAWHQIVIDNEFGYIKVIVDVDDEPLRNSYKKQNLVTYTQTPFASEELVAPYRPSNPPQPGTHIYVGGVPAEMSNYPTLFGCIRGLKIGKTIFKLQEAAMQTLGVSPTCQTGCDSKPCKHGGICEEMWQNQQFTCDCSFSEYAGPTCNTEASGLFEGQSILQYKYDPPYEVEETTTERLDLIFQVAGNHEHKNMILVFIYSERYITNDFLIVYLDPQHGVYINTNQGYAIHGVGKPGHFADGRPHHLLYRRLNNEMVLTVRSENHPLFRNKSLSLDEEGIGRVTVPENALDQLDTFMIGGILDSQFDQVTATADYRHFANFSGCLSEVTFYPKADYSFALRPLKDLRDEKNTTGVVTVAGPTIKHCTTRDPMKTSTTSTVAPTLAPTDKPTISFPPWNPGPADTVYFGPVPVIPTSPTTEHTTPTTTTAMEKDVVKESHDRHRHDDKIIAIALSILAFLLILAIIVAIILVRIRRRERRQAEEKKKKQEAMEMTKQPLGAGDDGDYIGDGLDPAIQDNHQNQNYLARLDEFSMVSATLGGRPVVSDGMTTFKPPLSDSTYTYSSVPQSEDDAPTYREQHFYNRKKNRPASSISEVLEEMERQRNNKDADPEDLATLGNGPLQPMETTPLACPKEEFQQMNTIEESKLFGKYWDTPLSTSLSSSEHHDDDDENDADNESDTPSPPPPINVQHEYNGDSGYEAESKPDEEEDETLMNDSFQGSGGGSYHGDVTTAQTPDTPKTFNVYSEGSSSPVSKSSNVSSRGRTPSDGFSSGRASPSMSQNNKIPEYGYGDTVIDTRPDFVVKEKPSITVSPVDHT